MIGVYRPVASSILNDAPGTARLWLPARLGVSGRGSVADHLLPASLGTRHNACRRRRDVGAAPWTRDSDSWRRGLSHRLEKQYSPRAVGTITCPSAITGCPPEKRYPWDGWSGSEGLSQEQRVQGGFLSQPAPAARPVQA